MNKLDTTVGEAAEEDILKILEKIRPNWKKEQIFIKDLAGGIVNRMFICGLRVNAEENDVIVIRVFTSGLEGIADRDKEVLGMRVGNQLEIAPMVYCRFNNGMAYRYEKGFNMAMADQTNEAFARQVAKSFARLHLVDYKKILREFGESETIEKYKTCFSLSNFVSDLLKEVPERYEDAERENIRKEEFVTKAEVLTEVRCLDKAIDEMQFPIVLCHNDPNMGNIVFDKTTGRVNFVDWEMADVSYCINDIGIFFFGYTFRIGVPIHPDHVKLYPSKEYQCQWIRWYLEYKADFSGDNPQSITSDSVERLYRGSNLASMRHLLCVFLWCSGQDGKLPQKSLTFGYARHVLACYRMIKGNLDK